MYLNSGDWVENSTALEFDKGEWKLYKHNPKQGDFIPKQEAASQKAALGYDQLIQEVIANLNFQAK
jgi:hypothetical protein